MGRDCSELCTDQDGVGIEVWNRLRGSSGILKIESVGH